MKETEQTVEQENEIIQQKDEEISQKLQEYQQKIQPGDLEIKHENKEIQGKSNKVNQKSYMHEYHCKAEHVAVKMCKVAFSRNHAFANKVASAVVTLKNIQGNPIINCGDSIHVEIQPTKNRDVIVLPISVTERGNGQYNVSYMITNAGDYNLFILVNNQSIINPPQR